MSDLVVAFGLVLVIEGLLWALVPNAARRMLEMAAETPQKTLQTFGWVAIVTGLVIVWFIRG